MQQFCKEELGFNDEACSIEALSKNFSRIHINSEGNLEMKFINIYECLQVVIKNQRAAKLISPKNIIVDNIQIDEYSNKGRCIKKKLKQNIK